VIRPRPVTRVVAALVLQAALVVVAVAPRLSAHVFGTEYLVRVAPLDPVDPFLGAYVSLSYPDLQPSGATSADGDVFIPLVRSGEVWRGAATVSTRPERGPYLACRYDGGLHCGIESLFLPQAEAAALERDLADGGIARLKVDGRGHAAVLGVSGG
jgi:uncharacterized membrane-anchored protein